MRYARNLAHGFGAVWNPGVERGRAPHEPEGMPWMTALHLVPLSSAKMSVLVQLTGLGIGVVTLRVVCAFAARLSGSPGAGLAAR